MEAFSWRIQRFPLLNRRRGKTKLEVPIALQISIGMDEMVRSGVYLFNSTIVAPVPPSFGGADAKLFTCE
jgi:hypothetical protein